MWSRHSYDGAVGRGGRLGRLSHIVVASLSDLLDQEKPFGRLALVHILVNAGSTLVTISLAGSLFFSISPHAAEGRVLLYLLLTMTPFVVVAPLLSPLLDRGRHARRASMIAAASGSGLACAAMSRDLHSLLLFPEAFAVLVLSKLYLVAKSALVPSVTAPGDDLASANAKLTVLASLSGIVAAPIAVAVLQLGARYVLYLAVLVFLGACAAAIRLPREKRLPSYVDDQEMATRHESPTPTAVVIPLLGALERDRTTEPRRRRPARPTVASLGGGLVSRYRRAALPAANPEVVLGVTAMSVIRGTVGFLTFFLAFELRRLDAATWWYGVMLLGSGAGGLLGALVVPRLRRALSEQMIILAALVGVALGGTLAAVFGSLWIQPLVTFVVGAASTTAKPSFDSLAQRYVPSALLGRSFARFETRLQLVWVVSGLVAVVVAFPLRPGDILVAVGCAVAAVFYASMRRSLSRYGGNDIPSLPPGQYGATTAPEQSYRGAEPDGL